MSELQHESTISKKHEFDLGLLLVHGIGQQKRGETLAKWGDALVHTLERATPATVVTRTEAFLSSDTDDASQCILLTIAHSGGSERWLISEACWAEVFSPPSFRELLSLSIRAIPWTIASHFAHEHLRNPQQSTMRREKIANGSVAALKMLLGLLISPFVLAGMLILMLLGSLPIPRLRSLVMNVQSKLSSTVGDCLAYCNSPMDSAAIVGVVRRSILRMQSRNCRRIAIIAHSQGAAVTLDALGGIVPRMHGSSAQTESWRGAPASVDLLITFGAGIKKLALLKWQLAAAADAGRPEQAAKSESKQREKRSTADPVQKTTLAFVVFVVVAIALLSAVVSGSLPLLPQLKFLAVLVGGGVLVSAISNAIVSISKKIDPNRRFAERSVFVLLLLLFLGFSTFLIWFGEREQIALMQLVALVVTLVLTLAGGWEIISGSFASELGQHIRKPDNVGTWLDFYASADPVSAGWLPMADSSTQVWNEGSLLGDHTIYWSNEDGFVLPLLSKLIENEALKEKLTTPTVSVDVLARARVSWLQLARWTVPLAWLAAALATWKQTPELWAAVAHRLGNLLSGPLAGFAPYLEHPTGHLLTAIVVGLLIAWPLYLGVRVCWRQWTRVERRRVLARVLPTTSREWRWSFVVAYSLAIGLAIGSAMQVSDIMHAPRAMLLDELVRGGFTCGGLSIFVIGIAVGLMWVAGKLRTQMESK